MKSILTLLFASFLSGCGTERASITDTNISDDEVTELLASDDIRDRQGRGAVGSPSELKGGILFGDNHKVGGQQCAQWNLNISGAGIELKRHIRLESGDSVALSGSSIQISAKTGPKKDGVIFKAPANGTITITGTVSHCDGSASQAINETRSIVAGQFHFRTEVLGGAAVIKGGLRGQGRHGRRPR